MKHLLSLKNQTSQDLIEILNLASKIKKSFENQKETPYLQNKSLIMLFQKTSTRTRLSFEVGMTELGGHAIFLDARATQLGLSDFSDEIKAIMKMGDLLMFRSLRADDVALAASSNIIPVIDGCSEKYHPCQALGDILTMSESAGGLQKIKKVVWLGIENNVSNTLTLGCAKLGIDIFIVSPERHAPSFDRELFEEAEKTGRVHRTFDINSALSEADFVHTDTWLDMEFFENGKVKSEFKEEYERRIKLFSPFQVNHELLTKLAPQAKIMHCMPCHIGYEISRDAIDSPNSIIFKQAENRKHIQKGILVWLLEKSHLVS